MGILKTDNIAGLGGRNAANGSVYFDGRDDITALQVIAAASNTDFTFGTGDFTIEFWMKHGATGSYDLLYDGRRSSTDIAPMLYLVSGKIKYYTDGNDKITGTSDITHDSWHHIALCRSSGSTKLFLNGVQEGSTYSDSNSYVAKLNRPTIGGEGPNFANNPFGGFLSNLRVVKGTALYTSNFTPPTSPLTSITNTKLLCCQSSTSTTATTVTPGSIIANGEVFATSGSLRNNYSVDFDGSDDYLTFADNSDLQPGSGDFTFEAWINPDSWDSSVYEGIYVTGGTNGIWLGNSSGNWIVRAFNVTNYISVPNISTHIPTGQWTHVAVTREGTNLRLFFNGVLQSTVTNDKDFSSNAPQAIASDGYGAQFNGKISNLRFVKGTAVYTSAFTPSTEPLTIITNTKLLCCNKHTVTGSSITPTTISTNGNPLMKSGPF